MTALKQYFSHLLSPQQIITEHNDIAPYLKEWRNRFTGKTQLVLLPHTTEDVSNIVKICSDHKIALVPQCGNTGLVGGQIPDNSGNEVILSLSKINKIRDLSLTDSAVTCEAGLILENLHNALNETNMMFPLRLASEGSAQIGGLISTNAGGTSVLKYGNMRDLILGIEAVMPNGDIIQDTHYLRKANKGFPITALFSGTEGTIGIITAASLKLFQKPKTILTGMIGCEAIGTAIDIFTFIQENFSSDLSECELIPAIGFDFVAKHKNIKCPFSNIPQWGILFEVSSHYPENIIMPHAEDILSKLLDTYPKCDAILAQSEHQRLELQKIRMLLSECQKYEGASIKHDISVPIQHIPEMIKEGCRVAHEKIKDIRPVPFGHIGDGNIHFNFSQPNHMTKEEFMKCEEMLNNAIFDIVHRLKGCFSAEHGIGRLRQHQLKKYMPTAQYNAQTTLKNAFDPNHLLNPGKLLL